MRLLLRPRPSLLPVLSPWTEVSAETAEPSVRNAQAPSEHPLSDPFLLSRATLPFIPLPTPKPSGALAEFFEVLFRIPQDPNVITHPERGPLLTPTIGHFGGWESEPYA